MDYKASQVIGVMEGIAPSRLAESWDNSGLQIGSGQKRVGKVLLSLDIDENVVDEAVRKDVDMIISHHPLIFKGVKKIDFDTYEGRVIKKIIQNDICIYAAHTNFDIAWGGTNDFLAELMGLSDLKPLMRTDSEAYCKLAVFVPKSHHDQVRTALTAYGGHIGNYSDCTFSVKGTGTFKPLEGTAPHIGAVGELEQTEEYKIETIVPRADLSKTISEMIAAHPYEEVAYDIYDLGNDIQRDGLGRFGTLEGPVSLKAFAMKIKEDLGMPAVQYAGDPEKRIGKVALCTGAGMDLLHDAIRNGCDCFVTGDIKYHEAQYALQNNIAVVDATHYHTEKWFAENLAKKLSELFESAQMDVELILSDVETNPFDVI